MNIFRTAVLAAGLSVAALCPAGETAGVLKVHFLDVNQGDSTLIQTPGGKNILIDGGQSATYRSNFDAGEEVILPFLREAGITRLDMVIATHPDFDHMGGLVAVLNSDISVGEVLDTGIPHTTQTYANFVQAIKDKKIPYRVPGKGELLDWGPGVTALVIAPQVPPEKRSHLNLNNNSIVIRLEHGDVSFLLTGDCEHEEELDILTSGAPVEATILKAGHHGSRTASGPDLYFLTDPEVVVVSAGKRNKFDHPHWEPIKLFRQTGARIL
nr:MBL fold metallo-hydrolase [bacterium]